MARAKTALAARVQGIALEGEFPEGGVPVIEITLRANMNLNSPNPVIGTYQGVWAGIQVTDAGTSKARPWLANTPPANSVIPVSRYLQMIGDAAMGDAHWVVALDPDLTQRLYRGDTKARADWARSPNSSARARAAQFSPAHRDGKANPSRPN